ncbi:MAG: hypothetical protein ACRC8S_19095 [Fimbriiglobus sp.]
MQTLHLRINDSTTSEPTPVRLRITTAEGGYFVPFGWHPEFPVGRGEQLGAGLWLDRERWCYTNGSSEIHLPHSVPLRIQAMKGPAYQPLDETVTLKPGQMALRFSISRKLDFQEWKSGDGRVHHLTPHMAALEGQGEDVDVTNLLTLDFAAAALDGQTYHGSPNLEAFSGQADQSVAVNTLNTHQVLGTVALLNSHRPVYPLLFGPPDKSDDWSISDWCDQCKRKAGLPVWVDPFETVSGVWGGEALIALLNGNLSTIELNGQARRQPLLPQWYRLLNSGFRVSALGASGKDRNKVPVGGMRTYVRGATTYAEWIAGIQNPDSFVTNGPLLKVEEQGGEWKVSAQSLAPFDVLELLGNGVLIATAKPEVQDGIWSAEIIKRPEKPAIWFAARATGAKSFLNPEQPAFAHTQPTYSEDVPTIRNEEALNAWRKAIESTLTWIESQGQFVHEASRTRLQTYAAKALARLA